MNKLLLIALTATLGACGATPRHHETRIDRVSSLEFRHGPVGAVVLVDGREVARLGDKVTIVPVADGTRSVLVAASGGATLFRGDVFIQDGTRKVIDLDR